MNMLIHAMKMMGRPNVAGGTVGGGLMTISIGSIARISTMHGNGNINATIVMENGYGTNATKRTEKTIAK